MSSVTQKCRLGRERDREKEEAVHFQAFTVVGQSARIAREKSRKEWQADSTKLKCFA